MFVPNHTGSQAPGQPNERTQHPIPAISPSLMQLLNLDIAARRPQPHAACAATYRGSPFLPPPISSVGVGGYSREEHHV
jgi:hypothetical protein